MVQRYEPAIKTEYGFGMYSDDEYNTPTMKESERGEYVRLETYQNEIKRLQTQIDRLKKRLDKTHELA